MKVGDIDKFLEAKIKKLKAMTDEEDFEDFIKEQQQEGIEIKKTDNIFKLFNLLNDASTEELLTAKKMVDIFLEIETRLTLDFGCVI